MQNWNFGIWWDLVSLEGKSLAYLPLMKGQLGQNHQPEQECQGLYWRSCFKLGRRRRVYFARHSELNRDTNAQEFPIFRRSDALGRFPGRWYATYICYMAALLTPQSQWKF